MKKIIKIFAILLLVCNIYMIFPTNTSNAATAGVTDWSTVIDKAKPSTSDVTKVEGNVSGIKTIIKTLLGFLQVASALIAILVIAFTGFNYIMASDADVKKRNEGKDVSINNWTCMYIFSIIYCIIFNRSNRFIKQQ